MNSSFRRFCAGLIGFVFLFSGILKLMDPVGTGLIVEAYFKLFHIGFLLPAAKILGELLAFTEATCGAALITGVWKRTFSPIALSLILFFGAISVYLYVENPDMDCGCFGEFIHLTHSQTLGKNIVLLLLSSIAFFPIRSMWPCAIHKNVAFFLAEALIVIFGVLSWIYGPLVEFTDFKTSRTIVSEENYIPSIGNPTLTLWDDCNQDCSESILYGNVVLVSIYNPEKLTVDDKAQLSSFVQDVWSAGYCPAVLSTGELQIPGVEVCYADYKTLVTLNRGNGGVTFLEDGYIYKKSQTFKRYTFEMLEEMRTHDSTDIYIKTATEHTIRLQSFVVILLTVVLLV